MICLLLCSCSSRSLAEFREEGEGVTRSILRELQEIQTRTELVKAAPRLTKLFNELVGVIVSAQEFKSKSGDRIEEDSNTTDRALSEQLRIELNRIYGIEGGREIIEKCEEEALFRLDAFEKRQKEIRAHR